MVAAPVRLLTTKVSRLLATAILLVAPSAATDSLALFQYSVRSAGPAAGLPDAATKPAAAYVAATAQLRALEAEVGDAKKQSKETVAEKRAEYERALAEEDNRIFAAEAANRQLSGDIRQLDVSVDSLRRQAGALRAENDELLAKLRLAQTNVSTAHEFMEGALNSSQALLRSAPELAVLEELEAEEAVRRDEASHRQRLEAVATGKASLLQFRAAPEAVEV